MRASVVERPASEAGNPWYVGNRPPLLPSPLIKLPLGSVRPKGWLRHQLDLMADGMTGRLGELSRFLGRRSSWLSREGAVGTEEVPYWLRGFVPLAALTDNERLLAEARRWVEAVLASQQESGYFGPAALEPAEAERCTKFTGTFVHALVCDALRQHYEHSRDDRIIPFITRYLVYCRHLPDAKFVPDAETIDKRRSGELLEHIHWIYNRVGRAWLLELAARTFSTLPHPTDPWPGRDAMLAAGENDMPRRYRTDEWLAHHVVDFTHRVRYPGTYYAQSKAAWHLAASEYWYRQHLGTWGQQPRGIYGADEVIRSTYVDPRQGCETCAMVELNKGFYLLGRITGDPKYADRCEDVTLNHFPAAQTPDLGGLHYLTASNQPQLDASESHLYANKGRQVCYSPHLYRCCQHNVAMGWPWYAQHLWQATADSGLAAWLYAASQVTARVGEEGAEVTLDEETDYPFDTAVRLTVTTAEPVAFPLYLRVPRWCEGFRVAANGAMLDVEARPQSYARVERLWADGDTVEIEMPVGLSLTQWPRNGSVTVDRGPLSYSVRIDEQWRRCGGTDAWPEWEVLPASPWNYGLIVDRENPAASLEVSQRRAVADQPWTLDAAPIEIEARAKRIPNWTLESQTVQELRPSPICSDQPEETVTLIPLGCARLRMACLPVIGNGDDAREW